MRAVLVAIEGIDGSGKGTQAVRLRDGLAAGGRSASLIAFPRYSETEFGRTVARYLNGEFGDLSVAGAHFAALLYAGDRFESLPVIERERAAHDVLIFDRFVPSNVAHQAAKLELDAQRGFIEWIEAIEYGVYRLPRPDLVIYLDIPVRDAQRLIALKPSRAYTTKAADLHEADGRYLERTASVYSRLAERDANWRVVPCTRAGQLRAVDEIAAEVMGHVLKCLADGCGKHILDGNPTGGTSS